MKTEMKKKALAILVSLAMALTVMPVMGSAVYADEDPPQKYGTITIDLDADTLDVPQEIYFSRLKDSTLDPVKIVKVNCTKDECQWGFGRCEDSEEYSERPFRRFILNRVSDGEEGDRFGELGKDDAVMITCIDAGSEEFYFEANNPEEETEEPKEAVMTATGLNVLPSLGDDETIKVKAGQKVTIGDLSEVCDVDGNSYVLHGYSYQVGDEYDGEVVSVKKLTKEGQPAISSDDYVTALEVTGNKVGQTVVEVTLCNNDRMPIIAEYDQEPDKELHSAASDTPSQNYITKTYTINVVGEDTPVDPKPAVNTISGTPIMKGMAVGKTALNFSWNKVEGADGYDIFFSKCNGKSKKSTYRNVRTIEGNDTFTWTRSKLKEGTSYKAYVKAYVMKDGKKTYVATSPRIHAYTGNSKGRYTNAKRVKVNQTQVTLEKGKTFKVKAKVRKVIKSKKLMPSRHMPTLRYRTSDKNIATVSKSGKITAKGAGTCIIYVFAHNGVSKNIEVTVK